VPSPLVRRGSALRRILRNLTTELAGRLFEKQETSVSYPFSLVGEGQDEGGPSPENRQGEIPIGPWEEFVLQKATKVTKA